MSPIRIAVLQFAHETVTFLSNDTTLEDFTYPGSPASGEALLSEDRDGYIPGFVQVAREHNGVELVPIESPLWPRTGTGSGWITTEAFEHFAGRMMAQLGAEAPLDGVYMALHGAMGVRGVPRPEAELAWRVREVVGPGIPIAATFDPHGNEDEAFFRHADLAFCVKYFPHYDMHLQGERAARTLIRTICGSYKPVTRTIKVPILTPTVLQWTGDGSPWTALVHRALVWEGRKPGTYVNVFFGFPWCDAPDAGMAIQVTTNGDQALADEVARDMAETAWRLREQLVTAATVHRIGPGVALARQAVAEGATPVVLADGSDRSGYATWLLREIVAQDLSRTLVATVADADLVARLRRAGVKPGDAFDEAVGGRVDPSAGEPVRIGGTVLRADDASGQFRITVGFGTGNVLVISPFLVQVIELDQLEATGLDPHAFDVIAIKSRAHFRRGFHDNGFAPTILLVEPDQPFLGTTRLDALPFRHLRVTDFYPYGEPAFDASR